MAKMKVRIDSSVYVDEQSFAFIYSICSIPWDELHYWQFLFRHPLGPLPTNDLGTSVTMECAGRGETDTLVN